MAMQTLYYVFSIVCFICAVVFTLNLAYIRFRGKAILGPKYNKESKEHKALLRFARNRNIFIVTAVSFVTTVNLLLIVLNILDKQGMTFVLWFIPIFVVAMSVLAINRVSTELLGDKRRAVKRKKANSK